MVWTCRAGYKRSNKSSRKSIAQLKPPERLPHDKLVSARGNARQGWIQDQAKEFRCTEPRLSGSSDET